MAKQDAIEAVILRNDFYKDSYRRVLLVLLIMVLLNVLLSAALTYLITHRPEPKYFATTRGGSIIQMTPLNEPLVSNAELLQWSTVAATTSSTYNFVNYRKALQDVSDSFTPDGWKEFETQLKATNNLQTVIDKKLSVSAVATGAPVILDRGLIDRVYKWKVQLPMLITYEGAGNNTMTQSVLVTMLITRVPTLETPKGIQIDAIYLSEQSIEKSARS